MKKMLAWLLAALMLCAGAAQADQTARVDHDALALDGQWAEGQMRPDEYHYFPFTLEQPGKLTARVQSLYANASFELLDADLVSWARVYVYGSQGAPGTEDLAYYLEPGNYYVRSNGDSSTQGDFRVKLSFAPCACDEAAGNDDYHGAQTLPSGETLSGVLTQWDEFDYYSFTLPSETQTYLTVNSEADGQQMFVLYDGDMVEIKTEYDLHGYAEEMQLAAGTYYLAIRGAKGPYTLKAVY